MEVEIEMECIEVDRYGFILRNQKIYCRFRILYSKNWMYIYIYVYVNIYSIERDTAWDVGEKIKSPANVKHKCVLEMSGRSQKA